MQHFRYRAATVSGEVTSGVLEAETAPDARLVLRQSELRVLALRPVANSERRTLLELRPVLHRWQRSRRGPTKAVFYESLGTLLRSGLPVRRALGTLADGRRLSRSFRVLTGGLSSDVAAGRSLEDAFESRPAWFDALDVAVIAAAVRTGDLVDALERLATRNRRSAELQGRLLAALSYPAIVLTVTLVVTAILGTRTLPPIVQMLRDADIGVPGLTQAVMAFGTEIAGGWVLLVVVAGILLIAITAAVVSRQTGRVSATRVMPTRLVAALPSFVVLPQIASLARSIADLTATGVPLAESLRIAEPTLRGPGSSHLRATVAGIRARLEQGEELAEAFDDGVWFDPEFHRLLAAGQDAGELPDMLRRLADRNESKARRAIDRLAALLEPAAILAMSAVVGTVVMAAVLPLIRMQELL